MISNLICLLLGGFVGMSAMALCNAAGRSDERRENMHENGFECSECGFLDAWFDETIINYCPICGRKVLHDTRP